MSETAIVTFLVALIAPFMVAYAIGYFIRRSIKFIAFIFGMSFFVVGILWYAGVIDSFSGIQRWVENVLKTGYDKTQQISDEIGKTVDKKKDGSGSQMTIIIGVSTFFTGLILGLYGGTSGRERGLRIISD
jgi:uncharacterized membrane protein (Fun14 family)